MSELHRVTIELVVAAAPGWTFADVTRFAGSQAKSLAGSAAENANCITWVNAVRVQVGGGEGDAVVV